MAEKIFTTRIQLRADTTANWNAVQDTFKPLAGELIFYKNENKFRIGNGTDFLKDLPFFTECHDSTYWFESSNDKPGHLIVKDSEGGTKLQEIVLNDLASASALAAAEEAIEDLEDRLDDLSNISPLKFAGVLPNGTPSKEDNEAGFEEAVAALYGDSTPVEGDIILLGTIEYVCHYKNGEKEWLELGDEGQYAIKGAITNDDVDNYAAIDQKKIDGYFDTEDGTAKTLEKDMAFIDEELQAITGDLYGNNLPDDNPDHRKGILDENGLINDDSIADDAAINPEKIEAYYEYDDEEPHTLGDDLADIDDRLAALEDASGSGIEEYLKPDTELINPNMIAPTDDSVEDQDSDGSATLVDELIEIKNSINGLADNFEDYLKDYKTMDEDEVLAEATLINPEKIGSVLFEGQIVEKDPPMATMADDLNSLKDSVDSLNDFVFGREGSESGTVTPLNGLVNDVADLQEAIDGIEAVSYVPETISGTAVKLGTLTIGENSYDINAPAGDAPVTAAQYLSDLAGDINPAGDITEIIISAGGAPEV